MQIQWADTIDNYGYSWLAFFTGWVHTYPDKYCCIVVPTMEEAIWLSRHLEGPNRAIVGTYSEMACGEFGCGVMAELIYLRGFYNGTTQPEREAAFDVAMGMLPPDGGILLING